MKRIFIFNSGSAMTMHATTKRLTKTAAALVLGLCLSGSLAMAEQAPAATPSTTTSVDAYPRWTPEERRQHWEGIKKSARDLWTHWAPSAEQRQHYWEYMQRGEPTMSPPAGTLPTTPGA